MRNAPSYPPTVFTHPVHTRFSPPCLGSAPTVHAAPPTPALSALFGPISDARPNNAQEEGDGWVVPCSSPFGLDNICPSHPRVCSLPCHCRWTLWRHTGRKTRDQPAGKAPPTLIGHGTSDRPPTNTPLFPSETSRTVQIRLVLLVDIHHLLASPSDAADPAPSATINADAEPRRC